MTIDNQHEIANATCILRELKLFQYAGAKILDQCENLEIQLEEHEDEYSNTMAAFVQFKNDYEDLEKVNQALCAENESYGNEIAALNDDIIEYKREIESLSFENDELHQENKILNEMLESKYYV